MVPNIKTAAALAGALAGAALGHGHVQGIVADGVYYGGFSLDYYYEKVNTGTFTPSVGWYAEDLDNGFVSPDAYNTSAIACHLHAQPANLSATVAAGGTVEFQWTDWGHPGAVLTYAALCPGDACTAASASGLDATALAWIKIDEAGYDADTATWAADALAAHNNSWTTTVPRALAAGNYVFRHEIIAVHGAGALNGAQNYPQCVNIAVTGAGTERPAGTLGEDLYSPTDAGIYFNPYAAVIDYEIPGPALMDGVVAQSVAATGASSSDVAETTTTTTTTTTAAAAAAAAAASSTTVSEAAVGAAVTSSAASSAVVSSSSSSAAPAVTEEASSSCQRRRHARDVAVV